MALNERKENMQTKKNRKIISGLAVVCVMLLCVFGFNLTGIYAEANSSDEPLLTGEPSMTFESFNVSYSNSVYILYAVSNEGFDRKEYPIKMLFWTQTQDEYTLENAEYYTENKGKANVNGKSCLVFYSDGLAAKEMTTDVYSRACVEIDGKTYYSEVIKFSVLEYVLSMQEKGNLPSNLKKLYTQLLEYGAAAQNNFGHNTHRPANGKYYNITVNGGTLPDGFTSGRYQNKDKVVITANEPEEGMRFSHWIDEDGIIVSFDKEMEITVGEKSKEYTAVYKDISNVVAQLMLKSEIPYNGSVDDIDLPTAVEFEINGESVTLDITWDISSFETSKIGKQNIYAELVDSSAYAEYGIEPGSIVLEINTLPFAYELDSSNGEYVEYTLNMAEKSNWQVNIEKYITEKNMSPKEAKKQAFIDAALQVGEAVAGGLISGLVSSGAYTGVQTLTKNEGYAKTGATIMDAIGSYGGENRSVVYSVISSAEMQEVVRTAKEIDPKSFINVLKTEQIAGRFYQKPTD